MEVRALKRWLLRFADAAGAFLDEAAFRIILACRVIAGRLPVEVERRDWNRSVEAPILVDAYDWTDGRRIFSVLVWPPLESSTEDALGDHRTRASQVKKVIARGAAEMALLHPFETDHGLRWDHEREVWTSSAGEEQQDGVGTAPDAPCDRGRQGGMVHALPFAGGRQRRSAWCEQRV